MQTMARVPKVAENVIKCWRLRMQLALQFQLVIVYTYWTGPCRGLFSRIYKIL